MLGGLATALERAGATARGERRPNGDRRRVAGGIALATKRSQRLNESDERELKGVVDIGVLRAEDRANDTRQPRREEAEQLAGRDLVAGRSQPSEHHRFR